MGVSWETEERSTFDSREPHENPLEARRKPVRDPSETHRERNNQ